MTVHQKKGKKRPILLQLLCGLLLSFTLFIFAPIELYVFNVADFWFQLRDFVPTFLLLFVVIFLVIEGVYLLLYRLPYSLYLIAQALLFGCTIAVYLQGTYLCLNNEVLLGHVPAWNEMLGPMVINLLIWLGILGGCVAFALLKPKLFMKAASYACALVFVMQAAALTTTLTSKNLSKDLTNIVCSDTDEFVYSANGDVLVYMMDTLDTRLFDRMLQENPEYVSELDGFTYYRNASSSYNRTDPSFVSMLTGTVCLNESPFFDYCKTAFEQNEFFPALIENGMTINVYAAPRGVFPKEMFEQVDNLRIREAVVRSQAEFASIMTKMVGYRYAPQVMQPFLFGWYVEAFNQCQQFSDSQPAETQANDAAFLQALRTTGVSTDNSRRFFKFYAMNGAHVPFAMNRDAEAVEPGSVSQYEQTLGSMKVLGEMLSELKMLGVYDASTIIILADHGENINGRISNPIFLVKYPHQKSNGEIRLSNAPVALLDLRATVLYGAEIDHKSFGTPVQLWEGKTDRERYFMDYDFAKPVGYDFYLSDLTEYAVPADATDLQSYVPTGKIY